MIFKLHLVTSLEEKKPSKYEQSNKPVFKFCTLRVGEYFVSSANYTLKL